MRRFRELISEVEVSYPTDGFFDGVDKTIESSGSARAQYAAYESAFCSLDSGSWAVLKCKALKHFRQHRDGRLKQRFFDQLNEAFAYQHLIRRGFTAVRLIPETGVKTPDIEYGSRLLKLTCEVKTIRISDTQIAQRAAGAAYSGTIYVQLSQGFQNKLNSTIDSALIQVRSQGLGGLVFPVVFFDDFTHTYYSTYRRQISKLVTRHEAPEVFVKVGLLGRKRIEKTCNALRAQRT